MYKCGKLLFTGASTFVVDQIAFGICEMCAPLNFRYAFKWPIMWINAELSVCMRLHKALVLCIVRRTVLGYCCGAELQGLIWLRTIRAKHKSYNSCTGIQYSKAKLWTKSRELNRFFFRFAIGRGISERAKLQSHHDDWRIWALKKWRRKSINLHWEKTVHASNFLCVNTKYEPRLVSWSAVAHEKGKKGASNKFRLRVRRKTFFESEVHISDCVWRIRRIAWKLPFNQNDQWVPQANLCIFVLFKLCTCIPKRLSNSVEMYTSFCLPNIPGPKSICRWWLLEFVTTVRFSFNFLPNIYVQRRK